MTALIAILNLALTLQMPSGAPSASGVPNPSSSPVASPSPAAEAESSADTSAYVYSPFGKRDPFKTFLVKGSSEVGAQVKDPLLNYDLSKFTLTGILWGVANPRAIVKADDGRGFIVTRGTRMGRNRGQVIRILKTELIIAEGFRDPLGKLIVSEYSMKIEKEKK